MHLLQDDAVQPLQIGQVKIHGDQQVDLPVHQLADQLLPGVGHGGKLHFRVQAVVLTEQLGDGVLLQDGGDAQGQVGLLLLGDGLGPGHDLFQPGRELVDLLEEILSGQRQLDMGGVALQQGDVQFLFQGAELAADGCLGHKAGPRCLGKAAGAGYPLKVHDLLQCHTLFLLPASKIVKPCQEYNKFLVQTQPPYAFKL